MLLLWTGPLSAQSPSGTSTNSVHVGPVSLYPGIQLRDVGIDSNVFNDSLAPKEDFTYTVLPKLQADLPIGAARLSGSSSLGFVDFRMYKDQQSVDGIAEARLETVDPARLRPFAALGFVRSRERTGVDIDTRALKTGTSMKAGLDVQATAITSFTGWVRRDKTGYGKDEFYQGVALAEQLDHTSHAVAGGAKFAITPLTTITVAAEVEQDRFTGSPLRNTDSLRVGPSIDFGTGAVITGRAAIGYRAFKPQNAELSQYQGIVGFAGVGFTVFNVTKFDISASRDLNYSYDADEPYYLDSGARVTVSQRVVGPLDLIVLGGRQRLRYQSVGGALLTGRTETVTTAGGGLGIRVGDQMRFTLTFDNAHRRTTGSGAREYDRHRVLGSVEYTL